MMNRRSLLAAGVGLSATAGVSVIGARPRPKPGSTVPWDHLASKLTGDLVTPGHDDYDRARQLASAMFDSIHPQAVVQAETARDVRTAMLFAQDNGVHTAVRSGGHSYGGWSTSEGMVINLTRLNRVRPGPDSVSVGPGALAVDIVSQLSPHGLTVPGGFCATVSPGGFFTGGGTGWLYRKYGPASDSLRSAQVVLADGRIVTASEDSHRDLLWALRGGGGGNFGIVTDFELEPARIPRVGHYTLTWSWDDAQRAVQGFLDWSVRASADLAADGILDLPDAKPGAQPVFVVTGAHLGTMKQLEAELAELVSLVGKEPATRAVEDMSYEKAMMRVFGCEDTAPEECRLVGANRHAAVPRQAWVKNRGRKFSRVLPSSGVDALLAAFDKDRRAGQSRAVSLLALGKNANIPSVDSTAWPHRDALYSGTLMVNLSDPTPDAEDRAAAESWVNDQFDAIDPYSNGRSYVNFPDVELTDHAEAYYGPNLPRLSEIKRTYDPHGFFTFPHAVPA
ncbi:FAD-binding oxidoreductase [Streptomyces sp. AJS327]|uniref:FAD-binding oxidoreductase n=1 Tax=Streptomyces sp. AJS327 TaxID=2545265 RepID=UPI0015DFD2F6|nr:FAD-binding oxidoreductase [Streptomyces sp. AJS327]MBA0051246.1 FAD-binding oxidoreductase [Streptomyces sp. AJS327]